METQESIKRNQSKKMKQPGYNNKIQNLIPDDISLQDNQVMATSLRIMFANSGLLGATVRAANNRFTEFPGTAFLSCFSVSFLVNAMMGNQATHCLAPLSLLMPDRLQHGPL